MDNKKPTAATADLTADLTVEQMRNINGGMLPPGFPGYLSLFETQQATASHEHPLKEGQDRKYQGLVY